MGTIERFAAWWAVEDFVAVVLSWAKEKFGAGVRLVEQQGGTNVSLQLPPLGEGMRLSSVFQLLEQNKTKLSIAEYSLGQTTLEQIFIRFAQTQEGEGEFVRGVKSAAPITHDVQNISEGKESEVVGAAVNIDVRDI